MSVNIVASCGPMQLSAQAAEHREGTADLDLHDGVGEVAEAHAAPLLGHERAPQALRAGLALQLSDDVEVRPRPDLCLGGQHVVVDELRHLAPAAP